MSDIFISYAREDRPKAQQLAEALVCQGWPVWWDKDIPGGKKFGDVILEKLNTADAILVLWSESSIKSDWVLDEAQVAKKRNVLIPVFIERVIPPLGYGQIHAADLVGWDGSANASGFVRLVQDIKGIIGSPSASNVTNSAPVNSASKPEAQVEKIRPIATDSPIEIKIPQRIVNSSTILTTSSRNKILAILALIIVIVGLIFMGNRSSSSSETQAPASAAVESDAYSGGMKLYNAGNYTEAYPLLLKAANAGDTNAQVNLGWMYEYGKGVKQNDDEAVKWYSMAADQGNAHGQFNFGNMYREGKGVAKNDAEAVKWYRISADHGDTDGQSNLGWMYDYGKGVKENDAEAVKWYRKAAEQGNALGQNNLGAMYEDGSGVTKNREEAIKWYRLAAKQGNKGAQANLIRLGETW